MSIAENAGDISSIGTRIAAGESALRIPKSMNDIDLMRRLDIEDIEKHIGDKILAECFVLETLPLQKTLSQYYIRFLEAPRGDTLPDLIEASGKYQRS